MKKSDLAETLAHELRHFAQFKRGLYTSEEMSSFYAASGEHDDYRPEQDAIPFGQSVAPQLEPFLDVQPFQAHGLQEMYEPASTALPDLPFRDQTEKFLDTTGFIARVTETDPPGLLLFQEVQGENEFAPRQWLFNQPAVKDLLGRINTAFAEKKIGFVEARYLCDRVIDKTERFGDESSRSLAMSFRHKNFDLIE